MEAINNGYRNIVLECPTGSGKSALAKTIAQAFGVPSYIVTHLKGLQAQYLKEMPYMKSVMGRGNYDCLLVGNGVFKDIELILGSPNEPLPSKTFNTISLCFL